MPDADPKKKPTGASSNQEPTIRVTSGWTPTKINQAQRQADLGDLSLAADLWERVMGDERALGPLQALCGITGLPLSFESAVGDDKDPRVEALESDFWISLPDEICGEVIRWASGLGIALLQIKDWETDPDSGRVLPVCEVWHPRNLKWDGELGTWKVRTKDSGGRYVEIEPGDGEWILVTPYGRKRPWAKAPWYSLGLLWLVTQYAKLDWADYNDVHGKPYKVVENVAPEKAGLADDVEIQELTNRIAALARGGSITLPDGYTLKLLEATARGWDSFVKLIDEVWPKAVSIALTGQNLSTQVEGGSFAAATVHANVSHDRIRTFAESLALEARSQLLVWWCEFNFGDRKCPWLRWDTDAPSDRAADAQVFSTFAQGLSTLESAGYVLEDGQEDQLEAMLGLRFKKKPKPPPPAFPPSPPPSGGDGEDGDGEDEDEDEDEGDDGQLSRHVDPEVLSARAEANLLEGFTLGALSKGGEALAGDIDELVALVQKAKAPEDIPRLLTELYAAKDTPEQFLARMERALVLAAMQGRYVTTKEV